MRRAPRYSAAPLARQLACAMEERTFPRYRQLLRTARLDQNTLVVGLFDDRDAIGMLLARIEGKEAMVLSISAANSRRCQGGGRLLMTVFTAEASVRGVLTARIRCTTRRGEVTPLVALLASTGWSKPPLYSSIYSLDRETALRSLWVADAPHRLADTVVPPWCGIEGGALRLGGLAPWCSHEQYPRHHVGLGKGRAPQDLDASFLAGDGLVPESPVIACLITHRISSNEGRVIAGAVRPDFALWFDYGGLIALAANTLCDAGVKRANFVVRSDEKQRLNFTDASLEPLIKEVSVGYASTKKLPAVRSLALH